MDRYGYDTYSSDTYCIVDKKKNEHIATVFHVTDADRIVMLLNEDEKSKELHREMWREDYAP